MANYAELSFFSRRKTFKPNLMTYSPRFCRPKTREEKKLAISSILQPFNFVSVSRQRRKNLRRALFAEFINEINESKSAETWPHGIWMPRAKIFTRKTIAEKLVNLNELNTSTITRLMRASPLPLGGAGRL